MALVKIVCPKCNDIYTVTELMNVQRCPICGEPLFEGEEVDLPDLSTPSDVHSLEVALSHGFRLLYFRSYDRLYQFSSLMKELYPSNYWTYMFELIGRTGIDYIFAIPSIEYELSDEEIKEDARARYYHYARRKYSKCPQSMFNKIAGYYPDVPGNNRKKWNKARTKYEEKLDMVKKYSQVSSIIREDYLEKLDELATNEDQKNINHNIKIWMNEVSHAEVDLLRYNQSIDGYVKSDYDRTPNPGNKPVFIGFLMFYLAAFITFVLALTQIILTAIKIDMMQNLIFLYFSASFFAVLIIASSLLLFTKTNAFKRHPITIVILSTLLFLICVTGIVTAGFKTTISWFAIFASFTALVALFYSSYKLIRYFPRKSDGHTIIGNYQELANNSFVVNFVFVFQPYQGEKPAEILFSQRWINGD